METLILEVSTSGEKQSKNQFFIFYFFYLKNRGDSNNGIEKFH
jgi:hypothetical protein